MVDYIKSIRLGITASEDADHDISEIKQVISDLNKAVSEATNDKVGVKIEEFRIDNSLNSFYPDRFSHTHRLEPTYEIEKIISYKGIALYLKGQNYNRSIEIAVWEIAKSGYPVYVGKDKDKESCYDKESLEQCLSELLRTPTSGKAIRKLMDT